MQVEQFVMEIKASLEAHEFDAVCQMANSGKMGFGRKNSDWGDGKGKA